ncbi:ankyrin repeats (3 copies) domain-containing protein [Trichoderma breve]|uniref:Ankyrin repeats (3 copies) domain-containing protein n=1 Tax=Trichoderma breve TaxID=2034170 RepID=A0A9W9B665_9HYPO|nr:ankyrin repeats (3 copies) domain-containing protein [Trichoderma breve]KAJ4857215.1 ankyrin repeats (3 copies) domain-containing protein [Trichoderma breve]
MDPSLIDSATCSLLGLTVQISGSLYGEWNYTSQLLAERLIYELSQLHNVMRSLELTASSETYAVIVSKDLLICFNDVEDCILSLESELLGQYSSDVSKSPRLPFTPAQGLQQIQHLQDCLSRLRDNIESSTSLESGEPPPKHTVDLGGALWRDCADYIAAHESARESRLAGAGISFVNGSHFRRWLILDYVDNPNTLFYLGEPGSGKTILTSLAIDEVQKWQQANGSSNIGFAYFYFSYRESNPMRNIVLALIQQLYLQSFSPVDELAALESLAAKSEHIPFASLVSVLLTISKRFSKVYFIFDALDECESAYKPDLLHLLTSMKASPARLLAFSRPHQTFDALAVGSKIEILPSEGDIKHYARMKLLRTPLFADDDELLDEVVSALVAASERHHLFLPIALQVDAFLQKHTKLEVRVQKAELHRSSYSAYQDSLYRIQNQRPRMADLAKRTLTWLFYSQRPLKTAELLEIHHSSAQGAAAINVPLIVHACRTLVRARETVAFTHISVKEFLEKQADAAMDDEKMIAIHFDFNPRVLESTPFDTPAILGADKLDKSPLEYAAIYGDESTVMMLLPFYTSESANDFRSRAFQAALTGGKLHIMKCLLSQGEDAHYSYLLEATKAGFYAAVYLLASYGSDIDNPDVAGESALMIAAREGWNSILKFLVKNGGDLECKDSDGQTALALAVKTGNNEGVRILLQAGAWPEASINNETLVVYAASQGRVETVRLLLDARHRPYEAAMAAVKRGGDWTSGAAFSMGTSSCICKRRYETESSGSGKRSRFKLDFRHVVVSWTEYPSATGLLCSI